jgi:hypothetical protein
MFSLAYAILPFADTAPAEAIRTSLAPFQRAGRGDMPDDRLAFDDETARLRGIHAASAIFTDQGEYGLQIEGGSEAVWYIDSAKIRTTMRLMGLTRWQVRFADTLDLDTFIERFCRPLERHPATGGYGRWRNPLGRWDWWDLGGRFDGTIIGERNRGAGRSVSQVSSGENTGRTILANIQDLLEDALDQAPTPEIDVRTDRNIEIAATLLTDLRAGLPHACPATVVLPPGSAADELRWLDSWPEIGPVQTLEWLGLPRDAAWEEIVGAAYARFPDHWVAGISYHH